MLHLIELDVELCCILDLLLFAIYLQFVEIHNKGHKCL